MTQRQLFLRYLAQTSDTPLLLEIVKAEGVYLYDAQGKEYIDFISGISVSNLGHCHPEVVAAVQQQAAKYMHLMVYGEFVQAPQVQLAKLLCEQLPANLNSVYFVNSGTEATEGAMKLAKRSTGRSEIVSFKKSYHGSSQGALSILGDEYFKNAYRPLLPDIRQLDYGDVAMLDLISERTAAVFVEPIQAESGIQPPPDNFLKALRTRCSEVGALLVFDEIQTGFGRTGSLFAFEQAEVVPDVLLLAKGMGGGMPIGAFVSSTECMAAFQDNPVLGHITTFGGHPVTCAAALANLQVLLREAYHKDAASKGALIKKLLEPERIPTIRQVGLFIALEFDSYATNKAIIDACIKRGLITDWFLFAPNCLRIAPPLLITHQQIKDACEIIAAAVQEVCGSK